MASYRPRPVRGARGVALLAGVAVLAGAVYLGWIAWEGDWSGRPERFTLLAGYWSLVVSFVLLWRMQTARGPWLGVDIGSQALRAAKLSLSGPGLPRIETVTLPFPRPGSAPGADDIAAALREAVRRLRAGRARATLSLPGHASVVRIARFPRMEPDEIAAALDLQLDHYLPLSSGQAVVDFAVLGEAEGGADGEREVLLAGAERQWVEAVAQACAAARVRPFAIEPDGCPEHRALLHVGAVAAVDPGPFAIVDLGAHATRLTVFAGGVPRFQRALSIGGRHLTEAVAAATGMPWEAAERAKLEDGLIQDSQVSGAMERPVATLLGELRRTLEFFLAQPGARLPARVFLVGGGAGLRGFAERAERSLQDAFADRLPPGERLTVNPIPLSPEGGARIAARSALPSPAMACAVGLALRELARADDGAPALPLGPVSVNLLPARWRPAPAVRWPWVAATAAGAALGLGALVYVGTLLFQMRALEYQAAAARSAYALLAPVLQQHRALNEEEAALAAKEAFVAGVRARPRLGQTVAEVASLVPPGVTLSEVLAAGAELTLSGAARSLGDVGLFVDALRRQPTVAAVELRSAGTAAPAVTSRGNVAAAGGANASAAAAGPAPGGEMRFEIFLRLQGGAR